MLVKVEGIMEGAFEACEVVINVSNSLTSANFSRILLKKLNNL